jgi:hypothetical protein
MMMGPGIEMMAHGGHDDDTRAISIELLEHAH